LKVPASLAQILLMQSSRSDSSELPLLLFTATVRVFVSLLFVLHANVMLCFFNSLAPLPLRIKPVHIFAVWVTAQSFCLIQCLTVDGWIPIVV
jgi:hypothetical protein